jgi:hypothetical protein
MGGENRRAKSLRIGVHHANAVVWEPVYARTATCFTRLAPRFMNRSVNSMFRATVTPSFVIFGAP